MRRCSKHRRSIIRTDMINIKEITKENIDDVLALKVDESQKSFVSSNGDSLAQAYVYSETAYPFAVYEDDKAVGFIMMGYYDVKSYYSRIQRTDPELSKEQTAFYA